MEQAIKTTETRKYAYVLRPLLAEERARLRHSLQRDGLINALVRDQHGDLLDGHTREDLCRELGITPRYQTITTNNPINWIKGFQQARRNLNREEMAKLTAEQIMATPHLSDMAIAKVVGSSDKTVAKIRRRLIAKGKVSNVVRLDTRGRLAGEKLPRPEVPDVPVSPPNLTVISPEARKTLYGEPPVLEYKAGKLTGLMESVIYHYADDGAFHSIPKMIGELDPDGKFHLQPHTFQKLAHGLQTTRKDIYLETRPGAGNQKQYRYYRQGRTIGLSVLKAKFHPVIEALKAEGQRPISHQSTGRFLDAARLLIQLLRDLEVE
jgi:hypothetical protein